MTYSTSNNPIYSNHKGTSIAPLHVTGTLVMPLLANMLKCFPPLLKKLSSYCFKSKLVRIQNNRGKCDLKCSSGVTLGSEQPNSPRLIQQLTWSDLMWRCDVIHTFKPGSYEGGASYIHRWTTGRVWPFLIQRQFFTLIAFCPLI